MVLSVVSVLVWLAPAASEAGVVSWGYTTRYDCGVVDPTYTFMGGPEVNKLIVTGVRVNVDDGNPAGTHCGDSLSGPRRFISFFDSAAPIQPAAGSGCASTIPRQVICTMSASKFVLDLGPGNDYLVFSSFASAVLAGDGNDTLRTVNGYWHGNPDWISCGAGDDTVTADDNDIVGSDCEHVTRIDRI